MSGQACSRAAADLTGLVDRLGRAARVLERLATVPSEDFGGLSGDTFRRHVSVSAIAAVALASDVALLAGSLATLGRELDRVSGLRSLGHAARAAEVEHAAQSAWREAVARFEGRASPLLAPSEQPEPPGPPAPPAPPPPADTRAPTPSPLDVATPPSQPASAGADPPALGPEGSAPLESELVAPLASELVAPLESAFVAPLESAFVPSRRGYGDD